MSNCLELIESFGLRVSSVLHLGAHFGQEAKAYWEFGIRDAVFVEADPVTFEKLSNELKKYPGYRAVCALLANIDDDLVNFYQASNSGLSSSALRPTGHLDKYKAIKFESIINLKTAKLDSILNESFELIALDVQGFELEVIRGGENTFRRAKVLWIEVSIGGLYAHDAKIEEVVSYLALLNFSLVNVNINNKGWGDALFIRKDSLFH